MIVGLGFVVIPPRRHPESEMNTISQCCCTVLYASCRALVMPSPSRQDVTRLLLESYFSMNIDRLIASFGLKLVGGDSSVALVMQCLPFMWYWIDSLLHYHA